MTYEVKINEVKNSGDSNIKGLATVVFGGAFKVTNIGILENKSKGGLFVSMPRYRTNERNESNRAVYKDICNPITEEFRKELYTKILEAYGQEVSQGKSQMPEQELVPEMPQFAVTVTPFEKEGSNLRGLARIYFEDRFLVSNVNILQGRKDLFVSMPSYKTRHVDEQGRPIYRDICYPVTGEFREKLHGKILAAYEKAKEKQEEKARENVGKYSGNPFRDAERKVRVYC